MAQYNAGTKTLSIIINDGTPDTATLTGTGLNHSDTPFVIGSGTNGARPLIPATGSGGLGLDGDIDMFGVWNGRTLTATEITSLYNSGSGFDYPFGLTPPVDTPNSTVAYMHQYKHNEVRLLGDAAVHDPSTLQKSDNWAAAVTSGNVRISMLTKDFWEHYPKEIELSENEMIYHAWPINGFDAAIPINEETDPHELHKWLSYHNGKTLNPQLPFSHMAMMQVGPGRTINIIITATDIVTTADPHEWETGQKIQFIRGEATAVLPTTTPPIVENNFLFGGADELGTGGTDFWIFKLSAITFYVYSNLNDALVGGATGRVDFTTSGSGLLLVGTTEYRSEATTTESFPPSAYGTSIHGVSIYDEFAIVLSDSTGGFDHTVYQDLYENHPIAVPDASWRSHYGSMGSVAGKAGNFSDLEDALEKGISGLFDFTRTEDYGRFNYGDTHDTWFSVKQRASLHRCWFNSHYQVIETLWTMYYHNPTENLLALSRITCDHLTNVDLLRFDSTANLETGYDHGKGLVHWGAQKVVWHHWGDIDGHLFGWLIDANRWYKDAHDDVYNATFSDAGEYPPIDFPTKLTNMRDFIGPLKKLCNLYRHTWDTRLLPAIHLIGKTAASINGHPREGTLPVNTGVNFHPLWGPTYFELTRDPDYDGVDGGIVKYVTGPLAQYSGDDDAALQIVTSNTSTIGMAAKAYEITGDVNILNNYLHWVEHYQNKIADLPATSYDGYGLQPGPIGDAYLWMLWPYLLKQLNAASITSLPDPTTATDYWGSFLPTASSGFGDPSRDMVIYIIKSTTDVPWTFNLHNYSADGGDANGLGIQVIDSEANTIYKLGNGVKMFYHPDQYTGAQINFSVDSSTNILTMTGGGAQADGISNFDDVQLVVLTQEGGAASTDIVIPVSNPQIDMFNTYYVRFITSSASANATFQLFASASDAFNNINPINFQTNGDKLGLGVTGENINTPHAIAKRGNTWHMYPGGPSGVTTVRLGSFTMGLLQPITSNMPECQAVRNHNITAIKNTFLNFTRGYLVPLESYPINIIINAQSEETAVKVLIKDADDDIVVDTSLVAGVFPSVTAIINNNDGKPAPWFIDISSGHFFEFRAEPVGGEMDEFLFLYGTNVDDINAIKTALGI